MQDASVDSTLRDIRLLIKSPNFNKDQAFDYLLTLQLVAKEKKHAKAGFYEAVLRAMRDKSTAEDEQFKKYLEVLIGDKDQEKVFDLISKVDKAAAKRKNTDNSGFPKRARGGYRFSRRSGVQCFKCGRYGHYQNFCPNRARQGGRDRPSGQEQTR